MDGGEGGWGGWWLTRAASWGCRSPWPPSCPWRTLPRGRTCAPSRRCDATTFARGPGWNILVDFYFFYFGAKCSWIHFLQGKNSERSPSELLHWHLAVYRATYIWSLNYSRRQSNVLWKAWHFSRKRQNLKFIINAMKYVPTSRPECWKPIWANQLFWSFK